MKISKAIPSIFKRVYPVLEPSTQMVVALSLLRFHEIDALPIGFRTGESKKLAISGYSCLSRLLEIKPKDYGRFLEMPCEVTAVELSTIDVGKELEALLRLFEKTKFGFSWVESNGSAGFASLRDLVDLYANGIVGAKLSAKDVASPVYSLPKNTKIGPALKHMFKRRIRRTFITGEEKFVTDRGIISYIFSASRLNVAAKKPHTLLDAKLGDLNLIKPIQVGDDASLKDAAGAMSDSVENCRICKAGVITPWDILMKPLEQGKLAIK
ncbi:MAG: CBS domain-containing protein [Nitrososphaerota archaeon]|nr:CBS domain-containing protein [Nitrososphaerota archaeon]